MMLGQQSINIPHNPRTPFSPASFFGHSWWSSPFRLIVLFISWSFFYTWQTPRVMLWSLQFRVFSDGLSDLDMSSNNTTHTTINVNCEVSFQETLEQSLAPSLTNWNRRGPISERPRIILCTRVCATLVSGCALLPLTTIYQWNLTHHQTLFCLILSVSPQMINQFLSFQNAS